MGNKLDQATEFVRLGYADIVGDGPFRSLEFLTDDLNTVETQAVVRLVPQYNGFLGDEVAATIALFRGRISAYRFGRSGSPVLLIRLPYTQNQIEERLSSEIGPRISDTDHNALLKQMREAFIGRLKAEQFEVDSGKHNVRVRWG